MIRRGFTIAEMIVVLGMTSVILTVGLGTLRRVMHQQDSADRENSMQRVAERLSLQLRADVHLAQRAEVTTSGDGEQRLVLSQPDEHTVTYTVRDEVLERTSTSENTATHRDTFEFPESYRLEFTDESPQAVSFTVFATPQPYLATHNVQATGVVQESDVRRAVMRIEATVGRDHRFLKQTRPGE